MADVTGPISTMPGSRHALPEGAKCDNHPDRDAVARVQGETDSMGSEMNDLCAECLAADREVYAEDRCGRCDWCKNEVIDLANARDYDEGTCGSVYSVCGKCREKQAKALEEELADYDDDYAYDDDDECPTCRGRGTVNPLTPNLPKDFLCLGTQTCPCCDGSGHVY